MSDELTREQKAIFAKYRRNGLSDQWLFNELTAGLRLTASLSNIRSAQIDMLQAKLAAMEQEREYCMKEINAVQSKIAAQGDSLGESVSKLVMCFHIAYHDKADLQQQLATARAECECERMRLVACTTAALGSSEEDLPPDHAYYSASYQDVLDLRGKYKTARATVVELADEVLAHVDNHFTDLRQRAVELKQEAEGGRQPEGIP